MKFAQVIAFAVAAATAPLASAAPQNGWYWNPSESGRGFFVERQNSTRSFVAAFLYDGTGTPTWFASLCEHTDTNSCGGTLHEYRGGQTLTGPYQPVQWTIPTAKLEMRWDEAGQLSIGVTDLEQPVQKTLPLQRFDFGNDPNGGARDPRSGWWWNPKEEGRGFSIEVQGAKAFVAGYMYGDDGAPLWYVGSLAADGSSRFRGDLQRFSGGQSLFGEYRAPSGSQSEGVLEVEFLPDNTVTLTLQGRLLTTLERFKF